MILYAVSFELVPEALPQCGLQKAFLKTSFFFKAANIKDKNLYILSPFYKKRTNIYAFLPLSIRSSF